MSGSYGSYGQHWLPGSSFLHEETVVRPSSMPSSVAYLGGTEKKHNQSRQRLLDNVRVTDMSLSAVSAGLCSIEELACCVPEATRKNIKCLDISANKLQDLQGISGMFPELRQLVADGNAIARLGGFPVGTLQHLQTLWLNKNLLHDLDMILNDLKNTKLLYLSLLGNPCCKHGVGIVDGEEGASYEESEWYRAYVVHHLPSLLFLDEREVIPSERNFFSNQPLAYDFVWVKLKQLGWCKGSSKPIDTELSEVRVWEVLAEVDVQSDPNPGSDRIATIKKGGITAVISATISHGAPRLQVCVGSGAPPRGWITAQRGTTPLVVQRKMKVKISNLRPLGGEQALRLLGEEVCCVVQKNISEGDVVHNRLKVLYHREYGPKSPSLRAQREELGLQDIPALLSALPPFAPDLVADKERGPDGGWFWRLRVKSLPSTQFHSQGGQAWSECSGCQKCKQWAAELKSWEAELHKREEALKEKMLKLGEHPSPAASASQNPSTYRHSELGSCEGEEPEDDLPKIPPLDAWSHNPYGKSLERQ
eukprot:TRINITY_DN7778_c0_g3_i1.p1 TRINITY_DN7778_c0_g3~~TRINITY_DN7778_c0_g3_i1.p1  ORF type:complete len:535 (+),score=64.16 TRINITY_DN7778_c0_g3_i1:104-1708(+)